VKIFAISDLHLSFSADKPMDVFGQAWENYFEKITESWTALVAEEDAVLLPGDLSWAMTLENAAIDIAAVARFPGKKIIVRGNHDYWWKSISRVRDCLPENFYALQNDALKLGGFIFCGTRGWTVPGSPNFTDEDKKIYSRECERLKMSLAAMEKLRTGEEKTVCLLHYPPFSSKREPTELTGLLQAHKIDCAVYGHLHGKECRADAKVVIGGVPYYIASCDIVKNRLIQLL
jgi:predicted phosphohydrolase